MDQSSNDTYALDQEIETMAPLSSSGYLDNVFYDAANAYTDNGSLTTPSSIALDVSDDKSSVNTKESGYEEGKDSNFGANSIGRSKEVDDTQEVSASKRRKSSFSQTLTSSGMNFPLQIKKMTDVKARACDECRRRKTACYYLNSENAKCFRCQMEGIDCTFSARSRSVLPTAGGSSTAKLPPIPLKAVGRYQANNSPGQLIEDYSQLPGRSLLKKTLSLQHPRSSFSLGQHGLWDQRVIQSIHLDKNNQKQLAPNMILRKVGPDSWFLIRNEGSSNERSNDCDEIERLVHPYGPQLVNAFFMYYHPDYPILHEKIFLEKYMRTYRELLPALLGAVYLLGMRCWNRSSELVTIQKPEGIIPRLYELSLNTFFKASGGSSLSIVQAGLLLLQCSYADSRNLSICSVINGASYRLALNRNCLHWKLPRWEINLRMRLSWAIYSQSTWISLFESIPPLIHDPYWYLSALNSDMFDHYYSHDSVPNGTLFIQLTKLSLIVHDMHNLLSSKLCMMYSSELSAQQAFANNANVNILNASSPTELGSSERSTVSPEPSQSSNKQGKISAEYILEMIKPIQLRLHDWYSKLPSSLTNMDADPPTGSFTLRIAHIAAEVTLHRFIIRSVCSQNQSVSLEPGFMDLLRSTAKERLDVAHSLLKLLRPQHLQQFWYFASSQQIAIIGVFAALMYTTSTTKNEADYYATMLRDYIDIIQLYSDNDVMSAALRMLRSSVAGVPGLE